MSPLGSLVSLPAPAACDPFTPFIEPLQWSSLCVPGNGEEVQGAAGMWFRSGRSRWNRVFNQTEHDMTVERVSPGRPRALPTLEEEGTR